MRKFAIHLAALSLLFASQVSWAQASGQDEMSANEEMAMEQPEAVPGQPGHPGQPTQPGHPGHPGYPGQPPQQNHWEYITCGSASPLDMRECRVNGRIMQASLTAQRSIFPCRANVTWGSYSDAIWTRFGCVGVFRVEVRR